MKRQLLFCLTVSMVQMASAKTFVVTTTADDFFSPPAGSLRWAVNSANTNADFDTITFDLPPGTQPKIQLHGGSIVLNRPAAVYAFAYLPDGGTTGIELTTTESITYGIVANGSSIVSGFNVHGFIINVSLTGVSNTLQHCLIGLDSYRQIDGAAYPKNTTGVSISGTNHVVQYCIVAGHGDTGLSVAGFYHKIRGCIIGVREDASPFNVGNINSGISLNFANGVTIGGLNPGDANFIDGNGGYGIILGMSLPADNCLIQGNYIGYRVGNRLGGIYLRQQGTTRILDNVIALNCGAGITMFGSSSHFNTIARNWIRQNWGDGVRAETAQSNAITNNSIYYNYGNGVFLRRAAQNSVIQNQIQQNGLAGVCLDSLDDNGTPSFGNRIAYNYIYNNGYLPNPNFCAGIAIRGAGSEGNTLETNLIALNAGLGIDIGGTILTNVVNHFFWTFGVTNTSVQGDGPSPTPLGFHPPAPTITNAVVSTNGLEITISGFLNQPVYGGLTYTVEAYAAGYPDPSGYGEGYYFLGSHSFIPAGSYDTEFSFTIPIPSYVPAGFGDVTAVLEGSEFGTNYSPHYMGTNSPPIAVLDLVALAEDSSVTVAEMSNDHDPDGDPITLVGIVNPPRFGTAVINPNSTITYTPGADFNGLDVFSYRIKDSHGADAVGFVGVNVAPVNDPPDANPDFAMTQAGKTIAIAVLGNDTDIDGGPLSVGGVPTNSVNGVPLTLNANQTVTYDTPVDAVGFDSFGYVVSDGLGGYDSNVVVIAIINPGDPSQNLVLSQTASPSVAPTNTDVTFSLVVSNTSLITASNVVLHCFLPKNGDYQSTTVSQGSFNVLSNLLTCDFGNLKGGSNAVAMVVVKSRQAGVLDNLGILSALSDANPLDNITEVQVPVVDGTEPHLDATSVDGALQLSWPLDALDYELQTSSSLSPSQWSPYPALPDAGIQGRSVTVHPSAEMGFFRLVRKAK